MAENQVILHGYVDVIADARLLEVAVNFVDFKNLEEFKIAAVLSRREQNVLDMLIESMGKA